MPLLRWAGALALVLLHACATPAYAAAAPDCAARVDCEETR